jgi:hypothetical protein
VDFHDTAPAAAVVEVVEEVVRAVAFIAFVPPETATFVEPSPTMPTDC